MKMQRDVSVNGDEERTAKGSQLTRVVPPSFSVPFGELRSRRFLYRVFPAPGNYSCGHDRIKREGEEKHGKRQEIS